MTIEPNELIVVVAKVILWGLLLSPSVMIALAWRASRRGGRARRSSFVTILLLTGVSYLWLLTGLVLEGDQLGTAYSKARFDIAIAHLICLAIAVFVALRERPPERSRLMAAIALAFMCWTYVVLVGFVV